MYRQRSRRRLRPDVSAALDNLVPPRQRPQESQSVTRNQPRGPMSSTPRRRRPREPPFVLTPSALWGSLPLPFRIIVFLAGFVALYYFLFARHQKHDHKSQQMKEIHRDLEEILKRANESGFMAQNLVEAVLPDIFREVDDSSSASNGTNTESSLEKAENKTADTAKPLNSTSVLPQDKDSTKKKKGRRKKRKKRKKRKRLKSEGEPRQANTVAKVSGELGSNDMSGLNATDPLPTNKNSSTIQTPSQPSNQTTPTEATDSAPSQAATPADTFAETTSAVSANVSSPIPANTMNATAPELGNITATQMLEIAADATGATPSASAQSSFPPQFEELIAKNIPQGSIPILNWNPEAIMNESIPEQIFSLGERHDHVMMYKPLCLDTNSEEGIIFEGDSICGGFNQTDQWMVKYCSNMKSTLQKEYLLKVEPERRNKTWLEENSESIEWVTGLTVLQVLERNCGNIAHFAGRALLLQHIIENPGSYAAPPSDIANILIVPTFHVMKRFLYPNNYVHWHKSFIRSLVAPAKLAIGDLGNFLYRSEKRKPNEPLIQLLHNFSVANSQFAQKKYVCFKRALIPGYLKGRFFVNDIEYPSVKPSLQYPAEDAPIIPRDSLRLRERVSSLVDQTPEFRTMQKEIIMIDRQGKRRVFDEARKPDLIKAFEEAAKKHGYSFKVITFDKISFDEQYKAVSSVSIAIGIHGANLVNTMFMPPLAVLIELFPYGFVHEMYRNGGNAGLKYYSYEMSTGQKFNGTNVYRSPQQCVRLNKKCKVHYRDAILQLTDEDIANMTKIVEEAIAWCDKLPAPKDSAEPSRKRRRVLRRLLEAANRRERLESAHNLTQFPI